MNRMSLNLTLVNVFFWITKEKLFINIFLSRITDFINLLIYRFHFHHSKIEMEVLALYPHPPPKLHISPTLINLLIYLPAGRQRVLESDLIKQDPRQSAQGISPFIYISLNSHAF